jgi:hypothetical protein
VIPLAGSATDLPVAVGFLDRSFVLVQANDAFLSIAGSATPRQIGTPLAALLPDLWPDLEPLCRQVLVDGKTVPRLML